MDSETHGSTQSDGSRHLQNNSYVRQMLAWTEKHRIKEQQQGEHVESFDTKHSCQDLFIYATRRVQTGVSNMLLRELCSSLYTLPCANIDIYYRIIISETLNNISTSGYLLVTFPFPSFFFPFQYQLHIHDQLKEQFVRNGNHFS